jgi:hypothetical protein
MPRLNRVFEEMGIHYYEREVPAKVREHVKKKVKEKAEKGEGGRSRVAKATTAPRAANASPLRATMGVAKNKRMLKLRSPMRRRRLKMLKNVIC